MDHPTNFDAAAEFELCEQCHRSGAIFIRSMAKWSQLDWFGCDVCGHIFTRPRPTGPDDAGYHPARRDRRLTVSAASKSRS